MADNKLKCACGGMIRERQDELGGTGRLCCDRCGEVRETCGGCGKTADDWAVQDKVCNGCGEGCVDGSVNVHLSDSQQSQLLAWAEARGLLPT